MVKSVLHLADQVEIADRIGHGGAILRPPGGCLGPPPPRPPAPSSSSHSNTSAPQGGYDVPFQFHSEQGHCKLVGTCISCGAATIGLSRSRQPPETSALVLMDEKGSSESVVARGS